MRIRFLLLLVIVFYYSFCFSQNAVIEDFNKLFEKPDYINAITGFQVIDVETGQELVAVNPEKLIIPASVLKIVTSATALEILGADYRFKTQIGYTGSIKDSELMGDLVVYSGGDPTFWSSFFPDNNFLADWIRKIREAGIQKISGNIIFDGSAYNSEEIPPTWIWGDIGNYYGAYFDPFTNHDNFFTINFKSGNTGELTEIISTTPVINDLKIDNRVIAAENNIDNAYVYGSPFDNNRLIRGTIPNGKEKFSIKASMPEPAVLFGIMLKNALNTEGIDFSGSTFVKSVDISDFKLLHCHYSPTLDIIIKELNYESVNLLAEHLLVQLGLEKNKNGSRVAGINVIENFWKEKGLNSQSLVMEDGSGLSHFNVVSPSFLNQVLKHMFQSKNNEIFIKSLPTAGEGTLKSFGKIAFPGYSLRAKSGSMTRIRSYSGYLDCDSERKVAFTIMINHFSGSQSQIRSAIEQLLISVKKNF